MHWSVVERTIHVGHRECINGSNILSLPPSDEAYGRSTSDNGSDEATTTTTTTPSTTSGDGDKWTKQFLYNIWRHNHCDVLWRVHTDTVVHKIHSKLLFLIYMVDRHLWLMLKDINNLISIANSNNYSVFICTKTMRKHVFISLPFYLKIIKTVEQFVNLLM